jgi:hypothetical protein
MRKERYSDSSALCKVPANGCKEGHDRPMKSKRSPAPLFPAASKRVRKELYAAYHAFLGAFREASEQWRAGDRTAVFPIGSFPPAPRFVGG